MIIELTKVRQNLWRSNLKNGTSGMFCEGRSQEESIGRLIVILAGANDSDEATDEVDVRISYLMGGGS